MADSNIEQTQDNSRNKDGPQLLTLDPSLLSTMEPAPVKIRPIHITQENHEGVVFIWFDPQEQSALNLLGPLRAVNDNVKPFTDAPSCINAIKSSKDKIFFITSSSNGALINTVHSCTAVEAIFVLDPNIESIKGDFPKLFGIFSQHEELFRVLKEVTDIFEQIQFEIFSFDEEKVFLWSQLWKEKLAGRKGSSKKHVFIDAARQYYRDNPMILRLIGELDKSYRPSEAISWCVHSPFPSRFLHHAIRSHNKEQLSVCRPLLTDASRFFQQHSRRKPSEQVYRGMKLSSELLDKFEAHVGQLVCTSGFFPCTKSRTNALSLASSPAYRPDLSSVFFKIDCDIATLSVELTDKNPSPLIVFDVCTSFRILYVKRDPMTVIKMKAAVDYGKRIALDYLEEHKDEPVQSLLDELVKPPKPPTPPPPPPPPPPKAPKAPTPPPENSKPTLNKRRDSIITPEELKARRYVQKGDIDRALVTYQRIQPVTARILNAIGQLCADKKGDYNGAVQYYTRALKMQEETNEDTTETLTDLGNVYHNCSKYDMALGCHTQALALYQSRESPDQASIAANLVGIANAHWACQEYSEAIDNAQRALLIRESIVPPNEASVAATLGMLANIYQDNGSITLAYELCKKSLILFEHTLSPDSPILAELYHNLGTLQLNMELVEDACRSFEQMLKIYRKLLPRGHPDRVVAENDYRRVVELYKSRKDTS